MEPQARPLSSGPLPAAFLERFRPHQQGVFAPWEQVEGQSGTWRLIAWFPTLQREKLVDCNVKAGKTPV